MSLSCLNHSLRWISLTSKHKITATRTTKQVLKYQVIKEDSSLPQKTKQTNKHATYTLLQTTQWPLKKYSSYLRTAAGGAKYKTFSLFRIDIHTESNKHFNLKLGHLSRQIWRPLRCSSIGGNRPSSVRRVGEHRDRRMLRGRFQVEAFDCSLLNVHFITLTRLTGTGNGP